MMSYRGIPAGYEDDDELDLMMHSTQNLKITVVPDITTAAGLDETNFDSKINSDMEQWFEEFRGTYSKCKYIFMYACSYTYVPIRLELK